jgi:predicted acylesterase/phospholipase RssA
MMGRVGVVLSTGDLRGVFAHAGFLLALEELGIPYQAMAGSSAGAIVASIVASGTPIKEFSEWLKGLKQEHYWQPDPIFTILYNILVKSGRGYTGIVSTDRLEKTITGLLKAKTFESCPLSLYLVATNLTRGVKEVFHSGEIAPRAVASAAIPALFKAKRIGESYYVDGGVFEITPKSAVCCKEELDVLIVNRITSGLDRMKGDNQFLEEPWSLIQLTGRILNAVHERDEVVDESGTTSCPCGCKAAILAVVPRISPIHRLEPERGPDLIRQGYEETLRLLPPLLEGLGGRASGATAKRQPSCD